MAAASAPRGGGDACGAPPVLLAATINLGRCGDNGGCRLHNEASMGHGVGAPSRPHPQHAKVSDLLDLHALVALDSSARSSSTSL
jgi:hypothetical protein